MGEEEEVWKIREKNRRRGIGRDRLERNGG
jgi:hypothetical protein